jgi:hypothetical protein
VSPRGFDPHAMFVAIEQAKEQRGLSWAGVAHEMAPPLEHPRPGAPFHPIAASTVTRLRAGGDTTCQHALVMLRWLGRPPEDFIAEPAPDTVGVPLPDAAPDLALRWDLAHTYEALDDMRTARGASWSQVARRLHCTPNELTGLRTARYGTRMRLAMRIAQALRRPARDFIVIVPR